MRMAREAISSAAPQGLALTLGVGLMVIVVDVLMVRVGEGETDEKLLMRINLIFFYLQKIGMFEDKFADQKVQCSLAHLYLLARQKILQFLHMQTQ